MVCYGVMSKLGKWHLREPIFAKFPGRACPRSPLEARTFSANNYSLFSITWGWNLSYFQVVKFLFESVLMSKNYFENMENKI